MLSTAVVAGLLAVVPATQARRPRPNFPSHPKPANNGYHTHVDTVHASSSCTAVATTYNFAKSLDAHAKAFTEAWAYACDHPPTDKYYWTYIYEYMKDEYEDHQGGFAFAQAIATAETYCRTKGNAWGCAAAYAHAQAWADASIKAHATAWAQAALECDCNGKPQTAYADAENYAYIAEKITAKVSAAAESYSCADSSAGSSDSAHHYDAQTCVQDIYAVAWAKSLSKAVLSGVCYDAYKESAGSNFAAAVAEVEVDITKIEIKGCVDYVDYYYTPQYLAHYRH